VKVGSILISAALSLIVPQSAPPDCIGHKVTVIVYDLGRHKYLEGKHVLIFPLGPTNSQMGYLPSDPDSSRINLGLNEITDKNGKASFDVDQLLVAVDKVNLRIKNASRKMLTKHYEIAIYVLTSGKHCTYVGQSMHQIMEEGVVGEILRPCKGESAREDFHAVPGEIIMFVNGSR
jgi:hypothetical protein